jgi:hypothetical protein
MILCIKIEDVVNMTSIAAIDAAEHGLGSPLAQEGPRQPRQ